jgi:hypothetical protein
MLGATFWATFSQTHLVTLPATCLLENAAPHFPAFRAFLLIIANQIHIALE